MCNIQVFLGYANFYWCFIQSFSKIAGLLITILKASSATGSLTISQSIDVADEDEVGESAWNESNLSNLSALTRSTGASFLTSKGAKKDGGNTNKGVKTVRGSDYLILATQKAFNYLRYAFT